MTNWSRRTTVVKCPWHDREINNYKKCKIIIPSVSIEQINVEGLAWLSRRSLKANNGATTALGNLIDSATSSAITVGLVQCGARDLPYLHLFGRFFDRFNLPNRSLDEQVSTFNDVYNLNIRERLLFESIL